MGTGRDTGATPVGMGVAEGEGEGGGWFSTTSIFSRGLLLAASPFSCMSISMALIISGDDGISGRDAATSVSTGDGSTAASLPSGSGSSTVLKGKWSSSMSSWDREKR